MKAKRKATRKTKTAEVSTSPFPNEYWERILRLKYEDPKRFNLFSSAFRWTAEIYEEQRDRALAARKHAA
jgi:hypothetical protein